MGESMSGERVEWGEISWWNWQGHITQGLLGFGEEYGLHPGEQWEVTKRF